ncbi:MAG: hypothetical protein ABI574_18330 [Burkholderiales bacterium]
MSTAPLLTHGLQALAGIVCTSALALGVERLLAHGLRSGLDRVQPLLGEPDEAVAYQRGVLTPGTADLRWVRAALGLAGLALWLGWAVHGAGYAAAALALAAALVVDLRTWQCVAVSPWQIAWQRGWGQRVRRLPLSQVAAVHVVERPAAGPLARALARLGVHVGAAYLAVVFHSGRAVKLPRTDLTCGLAGVRRVAAAIEKRQRQAVRDRLHAIHRELRARRTAPRLLPDPEELALRRELASLRHPPVQAFPLLLE